LHNYALLFVNSFNYLGHIIDNSASDNDDIHREIRNLLFIRTNILIRRFHNCSNLLKYCCSSHIVLVFMDFLCGSHLVPSALVALKPLIINLLRTSIDLVVVIVLAYTGILADLGIPSFDTILWNAKQTFSAQRNNCINGLVAHILLVSQY